MPVAGVGQETLIINVPGSLKGATENLKALLPTSPHAVRMLRNESEHPEADRGRLITPLSGILLARSVRIFKACLSISLKTMLQANAPSFPQIASRLLQARKSTSTSSGMS